MDVKINVKSLCEYAMFENDGEKLREAIEKKWKQEEKGIVFLDFSEVDMYATMFFNASIGWLILHYGEEIVKERLRVENLTKLGEETWKHSYENAIAIAKDPQYKKILSELDTTIDD